MAQVKEWPWKFKINDEYRPIAKALVEKFAEIKHVDPERVLFIENTTSKPVAKGKPCLAKTGTIPGKWSEIIEQLTGKIYEYYIEFYKKRITGLSREQIIVLLYHELRHIGPDGKIIAHDVEEWSNILTSFGTGWFWSGTDIPNLLADDVDWDRILARPLPGLGTKVNEGKDTMVTLTAADRSVTMSLDALKKAAGET